ncbi:MAG: C25 family cysteine peptidase [Candidatus Omnitrophota bacterium]
MKNKYCGMILILVFLSIFLCAVNSFAYNFWVAYTSPIPGNKIILVVEAAIYNAIYNPSLKQFVLDLENENYNVTIVQNWGTGAKELKDYFKMIPGLQGVIFIGRASWRIFYDPYYGSVAKMDVFPCDFYYEDLDGTWPEDRVLTVESRQGNVYPEIWVSRIMATDVRSGRADEVAMMRDYFNRNHAYRIGDTVRTGRSLKYVDDDWANNLYVILTVPTPNFRGGVVEVNDKKFTTGNDYKVKLADSWDWVSVVAHSNRESHQFYKDGKPYDYVTINDLAQTNKNSLYYFINGCHAVDFSQGNNLGANYIFGMRTQGLAAIGSSKSGFLFMGMGVQSDLGGGKSMGDAVKRYLHDTVLNYQGKNRNDNVRLFYGITALGDPTLRPAMSNPVFPVAEILDINVSENNVQFNGVCKNYIPLSGAYWYIDNGQLLGSGQKLIIKTSSLLKGKHTVYFKVVASGNKCSGYTKSTFTIPDNFNPAPPVIKLTKNLGRGAQIAVSFSSGFVSKGKDLYFRGGIYELAEATSPAVKPDINKDKLISALNIQLKSTIGGADIANYEILDKARVFSQLDHSCQYYVGGVIEDAKTSLKSSVAYSGQISFNTDDMKPKIDTITLTIGTDKKLKVIALPSNVYSGFKYTFAGDIYKTPAFSGAKSVTNWGKSMLGPKDEFSYTFKALLPPGNYYAIGYIKRTDKARKSDSVISNTVSIK